MNLISAENISRSYGSKVLFKEISLGISKGDKIALVAKNGAGKSSLLRILALKEEPETGKVVTRNDLRIGFMEQSENFDPTRSIFENIHDIVQKNPSPTNTVDIEVRIAQVTGKLGLHDLSLITGSLSGGQKKRMALSTVLIMEPDVLILDEPTNHLDVEMTEWLEKYLSKPEITLMMVTHDRYFLDRVCTSIYELDDQRIYRYDGDYEYFLEKKQERAANISSETDKAKNLFTRELEWIRKMPKARGTKSKARVDAFDGIKEKAFRKQNNQKVELQVTQRRLGGKILEVTKLSKSFGEKQLFKNFDYTFKHNEKIGIIGDNGSGKTTFLNIVMGIMEADSGKIQAGETVVFGYYRQAPPDFKPGMKVIDVVKEHAEVIKLNDGSQITPSQLLQKFLFPPGAQYAQVSTLSGGELKRLQLLTVLIQNPNFLILDEPTNDLDLVTMNVLEDFLFQFAGCLIVVTHDRYFLDKIADQLFVFENGNIRIYSGTYSEFRAEKLMEEKVKKSERPFQPVPTKTFNQPSASKKGLSNKEKFELQGLEKEMESLEKTKEELTAELNSGNLDHIQLQEKANELQKIMDALDEKSMRWLELSEKAD